MRFLILLLLSIFLNACGRADFSANTVPAPDIAVPIVTTGVDFYVETEQEFSNEVAGKVDLSNVVVFGSAAWPGITSLTLELRASLTGTTANGQISTGLSKPAGWDSALPVLLVTVPSGATAYNLQSANLKDSVAPILAKGQFWIQGRLRYSGFDLGKTLSLKSVYVHAEGQKDLGSFAPLLNLAF